MPADEKSEESEVLQLPDEPRTQRATPLKLTTFSLILPACTEPGRSGLRHGGEHLGTWSGEYIGHRHEEGADQGVIVINPDGSYTMSHAAWAADETVSGTWRLSYPREINGEVLQAIVLLDGITDTDWAVAPSPNRKIRLLWAMPWADGSATWVFDSELVRP